MTTSNVPVGPWTAPEPVAVAAGVLGVLGIVLLVVGSAGLATVLALSRQGVRRAGLVGTLQGLGTCAVTGLCMAGAAVAALVVTSA